MGEAKVRTSAKIKKAKATIEQLEAALEMYAQNWGIYPNDDGLGADNKFTGCSILINALESETTEARQKGGPYVKYADELKKGPLIGPSANFSILDPWGQPYRYHSHTYQIPSPYYNVIAIGQVAGQPNITYNLWSCGPDKNNDESNSYTNYPQPPSSAEQLLYDDIVNW